MPLWETMLAAIKLGAVVIPATTQLTPSDVDDRFARGGVRHVVTDARRRDEAREPERLDVRLARRRTRRASRRSTRRSTAPASFARDADARERSAAPLLHVGHHREAEARAAHARRAIRSGHLSTMYWLGLREGDVHQNISSPGWAKHAWSSFFAPWNAGATILVHDYAALRRAKRIARASLREHGVTTLCAPPTVWRMLILETSARSRARLRELASAGEPLNPEVIERCAPRGASRSATATGRRRRRRRSATRPASRCKLGIDGPAASRIPTSCCSTPTGSEADEGEVALALVARARSGSCSATSTTRSARAR